MICRTIGMDTVKKKNNQEYSMGNITETTHFEKLQEESDKDKCNLCNDDSPYDKTEPIDERVGYIEGSGQMCLDCYEKVYAHKWNRDREQKISRTLEDIYEIKDFWGVGEVKWNAIKHLTPVEFQKLHDTNVTKSPRLIGNTLYIGILLEIHEDKLCSNCKWCKFDEKHK